MKTMNLNELREQIADAHKKLLIKASKEELDQVKKSLQTEFQTEIERLKMELESLRQMEA